MKGGMSMDGGEGRRRGKNDDDDDEMIMNMKWTMKLERISLSKEEGRVREVLQGQRAE